MPEVVFGDNHFFGINHLSMEKAQSYRDEYASQSALAKTFRMLARHDVNEQMISAHLRAREVCDVALSTHRGLVIHPVIPYAHAINDQAASQGVVSTGIDLLMPSIPDMFRIFFEVLSSNVTVQVPRSSVERFVDHQLRLFGKIPNKNRGVLFLHNVFTDLLIGLGISEWFDHYRGICEERGYRAGAITYNPNYFNKNQLRDFELCIQHNHVGFLNNISSTELIQLCGVFRVWAMGVFGSGAYDEKDVVDDLLHTPFEKVVFASSKEGRLSRFVMALSGERGVHHH